MNRTATLLRTIPSCPAAAEALRQTDRLKHGNPGIGVGLADGIPEDRWPLPLDIDAYLESGVKAAAHVARLTDDHELLARLAHDHRTSVREALMVNPNSTDDVKRAALRRAFPRGSAVHQKAMAIPAPGALLAEVIIDDLKKTTAGDQLELTKPYGEILAATVVEGDAVALVELHSKGVNIDAAKAPLLRLNGLDFRKLEPLIRALPSTWHRAILTPYNQELQFADLSPAVFKAALDCGYLRAPNPRGRLKGELLDWQRDLLLDSDARNHHRLAVENAWITEDVLKRHKDKIYGNLDNWRFGKWNGAAIDMLVDDARSIPEAAAALAGVIRYQGHDSPILQNLSLTPGMALALTESPHWSQCYWTVLDTVTIPPIPAADILAAKHPGKVALLLANMDPQEVDWSLEECRQILAYPDLQPMAHERNTAEVRYVTLRLGDNVAAWKMLHSLADDWPGDIDHLVDAALALAADD